MAIHHDHPRVTSQGDVSMVDVFEDGKYTHHELYLTSEDDKVSIGKIVKKDVNDKPTVQEINQFLQYVEDARVYPEKKSSIMIAPTSPKGIYIKTPKFGSLFTMEEEDSDWVVRDFRHEISIMEQIRLHPPHPNIVRYYGCRTNRGHITGIVLEQLKKTLNDARHEILNTPAFLAELQSAVGFLHFLGLAHNDLSPLNVMVKDGRPVLIDFGGCAPVGKRVTSRGSPGFCKEPFAFSGNGA